jgi:hypothetical protein
VIDVGGRHVQFMGDIEDRRLPKSDLPEQAFRGRDNPL